MDETEARSMVCECVFILALLRVELTQLAGEFTCLPNELVQCARPMGLKHPKRVNKLLSARFPRESESSKPLAHALKPAERLNPWPASSFGAFRLSSIQRPASSLQMSVRCLKGCLLGYFGQNISHSRRRQTKHQTIGNKCMQLWLLPQSDADRVGSRRSCLLREMRVASPESRVPTHEPKPMTQQHNPLAKSVHSRPAQVSQSESSGCFQA